jgi:hypothetical protein
VLVVAGLLLVMLLVGVLLSTVSVHVLYTPPASCATMQAKVSVVVTEQSRGVVA